MSIKIITDSACDLPHSTAEDFDVDILPFLVHLEGQEFVDGQTIQPEDIYQAIREGKQPTTSQVPASVFWDTFTKYASQGIDCIYLAFSSKLSGTCNTARLVAQDVKKRFPNFKLTVCDTLSGSLAQGLIVLEAAQMALRGAAYNEIIERIKIRSSNNVEHIFSVDDLNYLYRGGRVSYASAFVGGILNVKPILHVMDGEMIPIQKVRGKNGAIKRIVELIKERSLGSLDQLIAITHADDIAAAEMLQDLIQTTLGYKNFIVNVVGSVLGCHIGLGGVAAFFVNKQADISNHIALT